MHKYDDDDDDDNNNNNVLQCLGDTSPLLSG